MPGKERATIGGGCFWCLEAIYAQLEGIDSLVSGYAGGKTPNPDYEAVCMGNTGHAEVVQIVFNPEIISFETLLDVFWQAHDPTTLNRQGNDVGTQYRSIILYHNEEQRKIAEQSKKALEAANIYPDPIVTEIVPLHAFYPAERYHQDYYAKNENAPYCRYIIRPKLERLALNKTRGKKMMEHGKQGSIVEDK